MKIKNGIVLLLLFLFTSAVKSQETLRYKESKPYKATNTWNFICENYAFSDGIQLQIAKTEKGGVLKLALETSNPAYLISGTVYIYFTDNTFIICSDKGIRENTTTKMVSFYLLSPLEMNALKRTDIQSIRFTVKGKESKFNSQIGNFTASNSKEYFSTAYDKSKKNYDTAIQISTLYK